MNYVDVVQEILAKRAKTGDDKTVLVTGGTGLIGRQVVDLLSAGGLEVTTVSLDDISLPAATRHIKGDLRNFEFCLEVTQSVSAVYHIAGIKGSLEVTKSKPASFLVPMLQFNTNLLEAARINGVRKLVFTSSIGAYSPSEVFLETNGYDAEPMDTFPGWAKRIAELQIRAYSKEHGLNWAVVRPCNVFGPGDNFDPKTSMVIPSLMMKILRGDNPVKVWGDGSAIRDFAYSRDVARGIILAAEKGTRESFVNLGSGVGYSVEELVRTLGTFLNFHAEFEKDKDGGFPRRVMDITRAREWLGYEPLTSLEDGLRETWDWFVENSGEHERKQNYFGGSSQGDD